MPPLISVFLFLVKIYIKTPVKVSFQKLGNCSDSKNEMKSTLP